MNKRQVKQQGRPVDPKYLKELRIDALPEAVAKAITKKPPKPEGEWRYLKNK